MKKEFSTVSVYNNNGNTVRVNEIGYNYILTEVAQYIRGVTGKQVDMDYIDDGIISYCDRVSPNVTSGAVYDELCERMHKYMAHIRSTEKCKDLIIQFETNDEFVGFRVETIKNKNND